MNSLDSSDKRYFSSRCALARCALHDIESHALLMFRFSIFRRSFLHGEVKDATRQGVNLKTKRPKKEANIDELFWRKGLLSCGTAKSLLNSVHYFNGIFFGLRGSARECRNLSLKSFE